MPHVDETQPRTIREAFSELTVDELKPLASLVGATAMRKGISSICWPRLWKTGKRFGACTTVATT